MAKQLRCKEVGIESDCIQAIKLIRKENEVWGKVEALVEEI